MSSSNPATSWRNTDCQVRRSRSAPTPNVGNRWWPARAMRSLTLAEQQVDQITLAEALAVWRTADNAFWVAMVPSQVVTGSRQVSQLPQGAARVSPKYCRRTWRRHLALAIAEQRAQLVLLDAPSLSPAAMSCRAERRRSRPRSSSRSPAGRRGRRARSPDSTPPGSSAGRGGRRNARRACRCPCRTPRWRR